MLIKNVDLMVALDERSWNMNIRNTFNINQASSCQISAVNRQTNIK